MFGKVITVFASYLIVSEMLGGCRAKVYKEESNRQSQHIVFIEEQSLTGNQPFIDTLSVVAFLLPLWRSLFITETTCPAEPNLFFVQLFSESPSCCLG